MPRELTTIETRLKNILTCVAITVDTLDVLVNTLRISALEAISNTTQSLLKMVEAIKQDKTDCAELMEHVDKLLNAIISVYMKSDTGTELPPNVLNQMAKFTETLHKIHAFVEAQQSGSKIKKFFRKGELNALLKDCKAGLQEGIVFFQVRMTTNVLVDAREMQDQAYLRHLEILNIIEAMSSSDSASSLYSGSYTSSTSVSMLPAEPKIFHGRDLELAEILRHFSQNTPRIAILGAGGMGKTSLARAVLHHEQINTMYHQNRFFVPCDTASSKVELAGLIGAHLGMKPAKDLSQAVLSHFANAAPSLLILDNMETPWEPVETRKEVEEFLSLLANITSLALVITMRGAEKPAKVQWTRPFLLPLQPLAQDAARKMFIDIADNRHSIEEVDQILHLAGNMPLSISLLAHLVDMEGCTQIISRWETEKTSLISQGYDRRSNLELSISLSLSSPRITSMPHSQDLLALLSILPDGLSDAELKQAEFPIENILGCKATLLRTALAYIDDYKRLKVLVPIREYMTRLLPPKDQIIRPLLVHFHELLELYTTVFGRESGTLLVERITSNYTNIHNVLRHGLQLQHPDIAKSIYSTCDFNQFSVHVGPGATPLLEDITSLLPQIDDHRLKVAFTTELLASSRYLKSNSQPEALITQALDHLKHFDDTKLESRFHRSVAIYHVEQNHDIPKATEHCQISLLLARANGDYNSQCTTLGVCSELEWHAGNYAASQAYAQETQKLAKISGNVYTEAFGLYYEALCWQAVGGYTQYISCSIRATTLLRLCDMSSGTLGHLFMNSRAEVHKHKSEYVEAHKIQNQLLQEIHEIHNPLQLSFTLANIAEIETLMGVSKDLIQEKIDVSQGIAKAKRHVMLITACDTIQADLNLREGDMSSFLFTRCLQLTWGSFSEAVSYCLERLGNYSRWEGSQHPSSWATVFLAHSSKGKERLGTHKALQFLGDVFLRENDDEVTATSLFTLALEGFTLMDVHQSRAECIIRLGDMSKKKGDLPKAVELWETARPLFERSSQTKQVHDIDRRLTGISEDVKEQHKKNLAQLTELNAPMGTVEEADMGLLKDELEAKEVRLVLI
ncbi:hypothetical protein B0H16DRAFT_1703633 [Mycena metata]|uniref:Novel STAND NTPase 1 domain-containing protein n=1 Tax=Mycena metata TaxID=1033252 RepID=A0AAD7MCP5_9AGAR|nr:hypothetical protein B0H16DRAFT_1703633 [Mycena metata]